MSIFRRSSGTFSASTTSSPLFKRLLALLRRSRTALTALQTRILTSPIATAASVLAVITVLVLSVSVSLDVYGDRNFQINLISEMHGMIFDILVLGILMLWLNRMGESRLQTQKYLEEIDDFRRLDSMEAKQRIIGNIKRLNKRGVSDIDLRACKLDGALMNGVNLANSNLFDVNLANAELQGADLTGAVLVSANLSSAYLIGASLYEANLSSARLQYANLWEANLLKTNFEGADLSNANMESVNCAEADFSSALLAGANLQAANLSRANLLGAVLDEVNMSGAMLEQSNLGNAELTNAMLEDAELQAADCTKVNFSQTNLRSTNFSNANLTDAVFFGADLRDALFTNATFQRTNLQGALNLTVEQFEHAATLDGAQFDAGIREEILARYPRLVSAGTSEASDM
jgi:BTB/POZ domain-containing protein KCTD9